MWQTGVSTELTTLSSRTPARRVYQAYHPQRLCFRIEFLEGEVRRRIPRLQLVADDSQSLIELEGFSDALCHRIPLLTIPASP